MKKSSIAGIALFIFTAITISFFTIAYFGLLVLVWTGTVIPILRWSDTAIAATHDLGLGLSSLGLVFLFILLVDGLRTDPTNVVSEKRKGLAHGIWGTDLYYLIAFAAVFIAWVGMWFFAHIGFVATLEIFWTGHISPSDWDLSRFGIYPHMFHAFGVFLAFASLVFIFLLAAIPKILIYRNQQRSKEKIDEEPAEIKAQTMRKRFTIESDWKYFSLVLLPFFFAAFAIWIFLIEGYIAKMYDLSIIWAMFPLIEWPPEFYQWLGIWLMVATMVFIAIMIILVRRAPISGGDKKLARLHVFTGWRNWISGKNRRVLFATLALFVLGNGLIATFYGFAELEVLISLNMTSVFGIGVTAFMGLILLTISLIVMFMLAVSLRKPPAESGAESE